MKLNPLLRMRAATAASPLVLLLMVVAAELPYAAGKQFTMMPLTSRDVYKMLHRAGREDAVPQGRVITQGIAAISGFALGLTKGIGGALLVDLLMANVTGLMGNMGNTGSNNSSTTTRTQEICFNTRNARSLEEAEAIADAYMHDDGTDEEYDQFSDYYVRSADSHRNRRKNPRGKRRRTTKRKPTKRRKYGSDSQEYDGFLLRQAEEFDSDYRDNDDGSETSSHTTTSLPESRAVNCIVIQNGGRR